MAQRRILELFEKDPAGSHLYARLLREASIADRVVSVAGQVVSLKRGQLVFGISQWADKTGLSEKVIRRVLKQLEEVGELGRQSRSKFSIISVLSIAKGQAEGKQGAATGQAEGHSNNKEQGKQKKEEPTDKDLSALPAQTAPKAKGSRLPAGFIVPDEWIEWAIQNTAVSLADIRHEALTFADYWPAQPGQKGIKADWLATWRNWIRKREKEQAQRPATRHHARPINGLELMREAATEAIRSGRVSFDPDKPFD